MTPSTLTFQARFTHAVRSMPVINFNQDAYDIIAKMFDMNVAWSASYHEDRRAVHMTPKTNGASGVHIKANTGGRMFDYRLLVNNNLPVPKAGSVDLEVTVDTHGITYCLPCAADLPKPRMNLRKTKEKPAAEHDLFDTGVVDFTLSDMAELATPANGTKVAVEIRDLLVSHCATHGIRMVGLSVSDTGETTTTGVINAIKLVVVQEVEL